MDKTKPKYKYGEDVLVNGQNVGKAKFDDVTGVALTPPNTAITSDLMNPAPALNLPPTTPDITAPSLINSVQTEGEKYAAEQKKEKDTATTDITKLMESIGVTEGKLGKYEEEAGAYKTQKQIDDIQGNIDLESRGLKNTIDELYRGGKGMTQSTVAAVANEAQRRSASYIADLSITKNILARDFDRAIATARRKVDMELAPLKTQLDAKKFVFDANKDVWSAAEKEKLNGIIRKEERAFQAEKKIKDDLEALKITLLKNNLPASLQAQIKDAKNSEEVLKVKGVRDYLLSPEEKQANALDRALKLAQIGSANRANQPDSNAPKVVSINGVDSIWDGTKYVPAPVGGTTTDKTTAAKGVDEIQTIRGLASNRIGITGSAGTIKGAYGGPKNQLVLKDWRAKMGNVLSKLTVSELARVKNTGVTFGALSEGERNAVAAAASVLNEAKIYKGTGENKVWTGKFDISEQLVEQSLKEIENYAELDFQKRTGMSSDQYAADSLVDTGLTIINSPGAVLEQAGY